MSDSGKRTREVSPAEYEELQELVFELVRERLMKAIGPGGMWSINFRAAGDTDAFFGETVAERLAWDVAANIAPQPKSARSHASGTVETIEEQLVAELAPVTVPHELELHDYSIEDTIVPAAAVSAISVPGLVDTVPDFVKNDRQHLRVA